MLQLSVTNVNIGRIHATLRNQQFRISITDSTITIYTDEIPNDVIEAILENTTINSIQNYKSEAPDEESKTLQNDLVSRLGKLDHVQLQLLSTVDMEELSRLCNSTDKDIKKVRKILELFGFDMSRNGMEYVQEAILIAERLKGYKLESLAKIISQKRHVEAKEVSRLIIARIKENFCYKKFPTILFIRLIEQLLMKG